MKYILWQAYFLGSKGLVYRVKFPIHTLVFIKNNNTKLSWLEHIAVELVSMVLTIFPRHA